VTEHSGVARHVDRDITKIKEMKSTVAYEMLSSTSFLFELICLSGKIIAKNTIRCFIIKEKYYYNKKDTSYKTRERS
jgi:hypothetical protein